MTVRDSEPLENVMRNVTVAVIASLFFTGCSNYWWVARALLPDHQGGHPSDRGGSRPFQEPPPNPSSEPVYGPDRSTDAPDAKQEESKSASAEP
ncbi:hypothetical protein SAMN05443572_10158 [Myxococcus fulvus]|uniref:Lipoprotein n=2 Tax=Myxococcus fulvus TaxID=33 RepID=A0A511T182_MYXFU|nr:hypothetical protein MFU01_29520 [Myxococcus fulvus]SES75349.1 hypothetical protein SAMN05443572_10158 [Myxococcus fulvus]